MLTIVTILCILATAACILGYIEIELRDKYITRLISRIVNLEKQIATSGNRDK